MYTPLEDPKIHDLVVLLYSEKWETSISKIRQLVGPTEASRICEVLVASTGWRERVVAAKIIAAFGLSELVADLVKTFREIPESHTGRAFAKIVATTADPNLRDGLFGELRSACPDTAWGKNIIMAIDAISVES